MTGQPRLLAVNHTGLVSGAEKVLLRLLAGARERGWATVAATPDGPLADELRPETEHLALPDLMLPSGLPPVAAIVLARRYLAAARCLREAGAHVDLIVANGLRVLPVLRLARPAAPVLWLAHSVLDRAEWRAVLRASASVVDSAVAVSEAVRESIGDRSFPVRVVWNGTEWPVPPAPSEPATPPVVGCASLLTAWKGQDVLLEAVARLGRDDVVLELAGGAFPKDDEYVASLHRRAAQPDLAGRVRFLGRLDDPVERMRHWWVAVVPSVDPEAGPLVVLEAMSVGVPVVATDHGGPAEVIGQAGLLVPPRDPDALARAIRALLDDPVLRRRCSEAGPRQVEEGLSLSRQLGALLDVVDTAAGVR
ncbi:MAG TPA: glycosyltransferase family 4 protein [Acidimicrobiales bacterium]|nr:glycosyltransferase family 4 protein [Acidimicrobiales bacterium]